MLCRAIEIEQAPVVRPEERCKAVDEIFRRLPHLRSVVVINEGMKPVGLIPRAQFLLQLSQRFGRALYENRPVRQLMQKDILVVPDSIGFDEFVRMRFMAAPSESNECFVITDADGCYCGVGSGKAVMAALMDKQTALLEDLSKSQKKLVETNGRLGREVKERRAAEEQAIQASNEDPLTGLYNRAPFVKEVSKRIESDEGFSLIFIDLDGFKTLNDVYGHLFGDEALRTVARRIQDVSRDIFCARFGGDEFAIVFSPCKCGCTAVEFARTVHELVTRPFEFERVTLHLGASLGLAHFPQHASQASEILQAADMAMLRAKREGGGVRVFNRDVDESDGSRRSQLQALTAAIQNKAIIPYFQPVYSLETGNPTTFEVLARWPSADAPLGKPSHFIPLAEREGLIDDVFWLVFSQACHKVRQLGKPVSLAFNVSARQLQNQSFPQRLLEAIERHDIAPHQFEVEVTETAMIANEKLADGALRKLASAGLSIALDDFGTGFSSLSLLHKFSFTKLKIDHSFVSRMEKDRRSRDIVASTVLMAERLGLCTAAEGVENAETLELLRQTGCDLVQGFYLAKPSAEIQLGAEGRDRFSAVA